MTFDILNYLKYLKRQTELYMDIVENTLTAQNPNFIDSLKANRDLYNEDGTPKKDVTKEAIEKQIQALLSDPSFANYEFDEKLVNEMFVITEEQLKKFIIPS